MINPASVLAADPAGSDWTRTRCAAYRGDYCRVPFQVLMSHIQELADQGKIQLRGFLVREAEGYALYADRDSAARGWRSDALLIRPAKSAEIQESLVRWDQSLVSIRGRIALDASDHDEYWAGFVLDQPVVIAGVRGEVLKR